MSRNHWRIILAALGLVALAALAGVTGKLYFASEQRQAHYQYQPSGPARFLKLTPSQTVPQGYKPHCQNPQTKEDADLCAQWAAVGQVSESNRMTSLNLKFALASLWGTFIATFLLIWNLLETRQTARRELRAYLFVEASSIGDGTHHPQRPVVLLGRVGSAIIVKNSGSTPAHQVSHWSAVEVDYIKAEARMCAPSVLEIAYSNTVSPGGTISADRITKCPPTKKMRAAIEAGRAAAFVYGAIEYLDVFGAKHRTDYRIHYAGPWPPPENVILRFSSDGNTAT